MFLQTASLSSLYNEILLQDARKCPARARTSNQEVPDIQSQKPVFRQDLFLAILYKFIMDLLA